MILHAVSSLYLSLWQGIDQFQTGKGFAIHVNDDCLVLLPLRSQAHLSFLANGIHMFEMLEQDLVQIQNSSRIASFERKQLD